ncbi:type II CAAX prenyl endopeptidase Rce1 family protein [Polyangium spumosum]|uniref:CAAX prenyl protease 2/Lysostaphin resistance protein A-like domain-containing protein n=1 Tax=Polyangium spumosum TaxID=889282 RepID=A0A6N7PL70_9BACT|nr:CPBP family glutamic-type intramembrane protease [Polyangium spumosum]MRG92778.1 hypothetical protein [Polyangium spumosum]
MPSATEPLDAPTSTPSREVAKGSAWLLGVALAVRLAEVLVGRNPLVAALVGAIVVDLGTYRAGVRWDPDPSTGKGPRARALRGIGLGLGVSLVLVVVPLVVAVLAGFASVSAGSPSGTLAFALLRAAAVATRDELLYRGLPLVVAARAGLAPRFGIGYAVLAGVAALALVPGASWEALVLTAAQGGLYAVLWARTGVAWASVAAHAGFTLLAGAGLRGGLVDVTWKSGLLGDGPRARGAVALVAAAVAVGLAFAAWKKLPARVVEAQDT